MNKLQGTHIICGYEHNSKHEAFAFARESQVEMSREMIKCAAPIGEDGESEHYTPGKKSWSMAIGCLLADDASVVHELYESKEPFPVYWRDETPDWSNTPKKGYKGHAFIRSLNSTGNIHSMASFNISLQGTGALDYTDWTSADFTIKITPTAQQPYGATQVTIRTDTTLPCDIILQYRNGAFADNLDFTFKKGETINKTVLVSKTNYAITNWSVKKAVANYSIGVVAGTNSTQEELTPIDPINPGIKV